jgi:beta-phosphoglucomutase-like phosphatase (HAD superfamily)
MTARRPPELPRAILLDFDGVLADTEPLHFRAFQTVARANGLSLSPGEYFSPDLLGLNDAAFLRRVFDRAGRPLDPGHARQLLDEKNAAFARLIAGGIPLLPGCADFVRRAAGDGRALAICSGARRQEIGQILSPHGLLPFFAAIVSADEVPASKPDPAGYLRALDLLSARIAGSARGPGSGDDGAPAGHGSAEGRLDPGECLAVEDSANGVLAARAAGLRVVAIAPSPDHPAARHADATVTRLDALDVPALERMFG